MTENLKTSKEFQEYLVKWVFDKMRRRLFTLFDSCILDPRQNQGVKQSVRDITSAAWTEISIAFLGNHPDLLNEVHVQFLKDKKKQEKPNAPSNPRRNNQTNSPAS